MITAIDTSVLFIIARREERWQRWAKALSKAAGEGPLVVCCVVFGEFANCYNSVNLAFDHLRALNIHYDPINPFTARMAYRDYLSGLKFRNPEPHRLPYLLIETHARMQAHRLAADSLTHPSHEFGGVEFLTC